MEWLFIPQLMSALVVVPCAVVWGRGRREFQSTLERADLRHAAWETARMARGLERVAQAAQGAIQ